MKIIKQFQDKGFTYEHAIADNAVSIPVDHHAYNYTWALVDKYTDKKHLFKSFEEYEKDTLESFLSLEDWKWLYRWCASSPRKGFIAQRIRELGEEKA